MKPAVPAEPEHRTEKGFDFTLPIGPFWSAFEARLCFVARLEPAASLISR